MSDANIHKQNNEPSQEKARTTPANSVLTGPQNQTFQEIWEIMHEVIYEPETEAALKEHFRRLDEIIPGVSSVQKTPKDQKPLFLYRDTGKVEDLRSDLRDENSEARNLFASALKEAVEGKSLVDLGAGSGAWGGYQTIAVPYDATNYIAVEPSNYEKLANSLGGEVAVNPRKMGLHIAPSDMRDFLRALPSNAENLTFLMSGIDGYILKGLASNEQESERANQYWTDVQNEIKRVLPSGGKIITYASSIGSDGDMMEGYELVGTIRCHEGPACVWKKI